MSKVNYNGDTIKNTLLPTINSAIEAIGNASSIANNVYFPNGNNWSSIKEKIENCRLDTKTYYDWLSTNASAIENVVTKEDENLRQIKVNNIKARTTIVK